MSKIIAIASQKGGVGKSTTAINLSACLAEKRKKVLIIDIDPQGNTTSGFGIDKDELENTVYELLLGESSLEECIMPLEIKNMAIIPSNVNLAGAEIELLNSEGKEYILKKKIEEIDENYDYIIIDCPPSINVLTLNALTTANTVLIPIQCEYYALEGLTQLMRTIKLIQERLNSDLSIEGVVFTMYDSRTNLATDVVDNVKNNLPHKVFKTIIPRNVRLAEAPSHGLPIIYYDGKSVGAKSYRSLAKEIIRERRKKWL